MTNLNKPSPEATQAREAIRTVLYRYATMARNNVNFLDMVPLFTADGIFELPTGMQVPSDQIEKVVQGSEAKYIRHHLTSWDVHFESDSVANVKSQYLAVTDEAITDHWGEWIDVFHRQQDGAWLIRHRTVVVDGADPSGWAARTMGPR